MADYSELLARLDAPYGPYSQRPTEGVKAQAAAAIRALTAERDAAVALLDRYEIAMPGGTCNWSFAQRVEVACMAATDQSDGAQHSVRIAELIVERDAAVLAEREACARVCDAEVARQAPLTRGGGTRWRDAVVAEAVALRLAAAIRARSNG